MRGPYRRWYFGFCANPTSLPWYQAFAVRNDPMHLQHTYAFTQVGDYVLFVEPYRDRIDFALKYPTGTMTKVYASQVAKELVAAGHTVVCHEYIPSIKGIKSVWNWIPSCVTVVKCATGFASFARTPKQLLDDLLSNGAEQIFTGVR